MEAKKSTAKSGFKHTAAAILKISQARKGRKPNQGNFHSLETRKQMSLAHKGLVQSKETREKISNGLRAHAQRVRAAKDASI